jgi:hypothetical protein
MQCPQGHPVIDGDPFCSTCGLPVAPIPPTRRCAASGHVMQPEDDFCGQCGAHAAQIAVPAAAGSGPGTGTLPSPERRCPTGHEVDRGQAFCGTCGAAVAERPADERVPPADGAEKHRPRTSRLRWVLAGGAVAIVLAAAAVLALSGHGAGGGRALHGELAVLVQSITNIPNTRTPVDGAPCVSISTPSLTGPDEVHQGAELVVLDQTGRQIGSAPLQPGVTRHVLPPSPNSTTFDCIFQFDVTVPQVKTYSLRVASDAPIAFTAAQLDGDHNRPTLCYGNASPCR